MTVLAYVAAALAVAAIGLLVFALIRPEKF